MQDPLARARTAIAADRGHADPALWIARVPDEAMLARAATLAAEGPRERPLWGMPVAIKDNIDVAGLPTTAACPGFSYAPERHAACVGRLLDAGAVVMGKTNLDQFATGLVGTRSPYGVPRNVFDPARVPGGSSSGSAAAVAAGIVPAALGTDTAGSGRVPAMFGNIVGLKPTIGSVSAIGVVPACRSIDTVSVFAGSVDEAMAVLRVIAGHDPADPYSRAAPFAHLRRAAFSGRARVATVTVPEEVMAPYARAAAMFAHTAAVDIAQFLAIAQLLYAGPWVAERTAALREPVERRPDILHPMTRTILEEGFSRRAVEAFDAFHALAQARRAAAALFQNFDALLLPTTLPCPTLAEVARDPLGVNARLGTWTNFVNLCDLAAIAVPAGRGDDGLPFGATLVGPAWSEGRLAPLADLLHRGLADRVGATSAKLPPRGEPHPLAAGETSLFCVGGHMAGLPLNHQLTSLGGRFLREANTRPAYRLWALGSRPGLVRAGDGRAIAGEAWALPLAAIGALLAQVPAPLGFGTVALEDGPCLGFLAEQAGLDGAEDISGFGGWRGYLASRAHGIG